jgi:hypothetical protein
MNDQQEMPSATSASAMAIHPSDSLIRHRVNLQSLASPLPFHFAVAQDWNEKLAGGY